MDAACDFGRRLAQDVRDYRAGRITWSEAMRGAVLHGPTGTGKTMFVDVLGRACDVPVIKTSYGDWQRCKLGDLGSVLQAMTRCFESAAAVAMKHGAAILFIDEIDSLADRDLGSSIDPSWNRYVVNEMLALCDGSNAKPGVIVIGACNKQSHLDRALVRPGRLERLIEFRLPSVAALAGIFRHHLGKRLGSADLGRVAVCCTGLSGAEVAGLVRDASQSARMAGRSLRIDDIEVLIDGGWQAASDDLRDTAAVHEAGHATYAVMEDEVAEIALSLVRRRERLGATVMTLRECRQTRDRLLSRLGLHLAGRAAEEVVLGEHTAGSSLDLEQSTLLAASMVLDMGFSRSLGPVSLGARNYVELCMRNEAVLAELQALLQEGYERALACIRRNRDEVRRLADALIERRGLGDGEIRAILRGPVSPVPMPGDPARAACCEGRAACRRARHPEAVNRPRAASERPRGRPQSAAT